MQRIIRAALSLIAVAALACLLAACTGSPNADTMTVNVTIDASEAGRGTMFEGEVSVPADASVYDALLATNVDVDVKQTSGMGAYIEGIGGLTPKDGTERSGWLYFVNDTAGKTSCDACKLEAGDEVLWIWKLEAY